MPRFALLLVAISAAPLAAQEPDPGIPPAAARPRLAGPVLRVGDRVRMRCRAAGKRTMTGRWLGVAAGEARLEVSSAGGPTDTTRVALESVRSIERSIGRRRRIEEGAGIGALVGLLTGVAAGFAAGDDPPGFLQFSAGQKAMAGGLAGAGVGALVGGIIGSTRVSDRWEVVPLGPAPGGAGPALNLRF